MISLLDKGGWVMYVILFSSIIAITIIIERTIYFKLTIDAQITISITDKQGRIIRAFSMAGTQGQNSLVWDGKDDKGHPVNTGLNAYPCTIRAVAGSQSARVVFDMSVLNQGGNGNISTQGP